MNATTKLTTFAACATLALVAWSNVLSRAQNTTPAIPMMPSYGITPATPKIPHDVKGGPVVQGIEITAFVEQTHFNLAGYPLRLFFKIDNSAKSSVSYITAIDERDFTFVVTNSKGEPIPLTLRGKSLNRSRGAIFGVVGYGLEPGQSRTHTVLLNRIYDLSQTGDYTVTVEREFYLNDKPVEVRSNPVKFSIRDEPNNYGGILPPNATSDTQMKTGK